LPIVEYHPALVTEGGSNLYLTSNRPRVIR
jgi:hypothetical protein